MYTVHVSQISLDSYGVVSMMSADQQHWDICSLVFTG